MNAPVLIARDKPAKPALHDAGTKRVVSNYWRSGRDTAWIAKTTGLCEAAIYNYLAQRRG